MFFENTILNFIYLQKLRSETGGDSLRDDRSGNLIPAFQFKQNPAVLAGAEVTVDNHPHPVDWLQFENSFGYVYAVNLQATASAKFLPFTLPAHYRSELRFDIPKTGKIFQHISAGIHFDYYFRQNNVFLQNNKETPTAGDALPGFSTGLEVYSKNKMNLLMLIFSGENITNTVYQSHLSRLKYLEVNTANGKRGIWNAGRNIIVKLIFPLAFNEGAYRK